MTNDKDSAVLAERVERVTKWLDGGCSTWGTPMQDIREILNALRQPTQSEPEAMRYGFDGFGYKYIDSGSGSDWRTRHPDAEPLYAEQPVAKKLTVSVVSAADGKTMHTFKIDPTKKTIVRPEHSLFGYVFEPEGDANG